jgi:hypothetical protein
MQHGNLEKGTFLSNRADFDLGNRKCVFASVCAAMHNAPELTCRATDHLHADNAIMCADCLRGA